MKEIRKRLKTADDVREFLQMLTDLVLTNKPVSDNPMNDGACIGFLISTEKFHLNLLSRVEDRILDGTLQKLELGFDWVSDNEETLCKLLDERKLSQIK